MRRRFGCEVCAASRFMLRSWRPGRGAAWQRVCFGSRRSPVQIGPPRPALVNQGFPYDTAPGKGPEKHRLTPDRQSIAEARTSPSSSAPDGAPGDGAQGAIMRAKASPQPLAEAVEAPRLTLSASCAAHPAACSCLSISRRARASGVRYQSDSERSARSSPWMTSRSPRRSAGFSAVLLHHVTSVACGRLKADWGVGTGCVIVLRAASAAAGVAPPDRT